MVWPLIASKEADLATGLVNNLDNNATKPNTTRTGDFRPSFKPNNNAANFNKYQNENRSKGRTFLRPNRGLAPRAAKLPFYTKQCETVTSDSQALAFVKCFKILYRQNPYQTSATVTITTSVRTNFKSGSIKTSTKGCNISDGFFQGRVLELTFLNSKESRHHAPCDRLKYIKHVCGNKEKSIAIPNQVITFLGFIIN